MSKFSLSKLVGSLFTQIHWIKVVSLGGSFVLLVFIGYGVYKAYFKAPLPSTSQNAREIVNYYHEPRVTFGCAHWKGTSAREFTRNELTIE